MMSSLSFLKLGGSLITDKYRPHTPRMDVIRRLAGEIAEAKLLQPGQLLLLGHGSGSFGHIPAQRYSTRQGVQTPGQWRGFAEVWQEAAALNRLVMTALHAAGLLGIAFPPSGGLTAHNGRVSAWDLKPLQAALLGGLLPVVYGDVVFDEVLGGTILSTEDLFAYLAVRLKPGRVLLAGREPGVWADFPACTRLVSEITPATLGGLSLGSSTSTDVTGGMASKVRGILALIAETPGLEALIFSGEEPGNVQRALCGETLGTLLRGNMPG
jgi:isopentenyl phosphate kinase